MHSIRSEINCTILINIVRKKRKINTRIHAYTRNVNFQRCFCALVCVRRCVWMPVCLSVCLTQSTLILIKINEQYRSFLHSNRSPPNDQLIWLLLLFFLLWCALCKHAATASVAAASTTLHCIALSSSVWLLLLFLMYMRKCYWFCVACNCPIHLFMEIDRFISLFLIWTSNGWFTFLVEPCFACTCISFSVSVCDCVDLCIQCMYRYMQLLAFECCYHTDHIVCVCVSMRVSFSSCFVFSSHSHSNKNRFCLTHFTNRTIQRQYQILTHSKDEKQKKSNSKNKSFNWSEVCVFKANKNQCEMKKFITNKRKSNGYRRRRCHRRWQQQQPWKV